MLKSEVYKEAAEIGGVNQRPYKRGTGLGGSGMRQDERERII